MLRVALRLRPMMVFLSGRTATPYGGETQRLAQAVGGLRTPLTRRQGQLRRWLALMIEDLLRVFWKATR